MSRLDLFDHVCVMASQMPEHAFSKPDDDWAPTLLLEASEGPNPIVPLAEYVGSEGGRELLALVVFPAVVHMAAATRAVLVLSAWVVMGDADTALSAPPSEHPDGREQVAVIEVTAEGGQRMALAPILRSETDVPRLGEWELIEPSAGIAHGGPFVESLVSALRAVRGAQQ